MLLPDRDSRQTRRIRVLLLLSTQVLMTRIAYQASSCANGLLTSGDVLGDAAMDAQLECRVPAFRLRCHSTLFLPATAVLTGRSNVADGINAMQLKR
ncbi:hypothetical protein L210DRAFT_2142087 [Boletus edulis BED1]|uniref:Uncharacterized protein n=1 Tax=Boletus edulis BED1 TaxID=1328754 RepID=A0AAD4G7H8_BOLED|nr:hypothetical protein L210DRAFT_2140813 [Boletus edulis BED1]KAF8423465.1 hypothetical protein L210DRAFT_2142087 [Boletus edulis BED1]